MDGGTNISAMGAMFRVHSETDRYIDMEGFANDLVKENIQICSGLTCVTNPHNGNQILIGLKEAPYLTNNKHALLSTGQAREACTYV